MIQVILLILKIIGGTLLTILCLMLFMVALVLFVPVFYRVKLVHHPEKTQIKAGVRFLFPFLLVTLEYLNKISYNVRIFGVSILNSEKEKKKKGKKKSKTEIKERKTEAEQEKDAGKKGESNIKQSFVETPACGETQTSEKKRSFGIFLKKIKSKIQKIRNTISSIAKKIRRLLRQKEELFRILQKPETKRALAFVWNKLKHLLRHILPRKIRGYVAYGADNPATTGQVLGMVSILYAKTGMLLELRPNFEEKQLEADVELKGRIQLFTLLLIAGKVFFHKELRQAVKEVKHSKESE